MSKRDRLIEILSRKVHPREGIDPAVVVADFLLDNDILPVVRCQDCKYGTLPGAFAQRYGKPGTLTCTNRGTPCSRRLVASNDFCRYGERKEDKP